LCLASAFNSDVDQYCDYFVRLAASKRLSDKQKITKQFVCIPPFEVLSYNEQDAEKKAFDLAYIHDSWIDHPINRLIYAGLLHAQVELDSKAGSKLLSVALEYGDTLLLNSALQRGIDPRAVHNGRSLLCYSRSAEDAKIMVNYGASVAGVMRCTGWFGYDVRDIVEYVCTEMYPTSNGNNLLQFYLSHMPLSVSSENGQTWMRTIASQERDIVTDAFIDRITMLLEHGCEYNDTIKEKMCTNLAKKSPESRARIEQVFKDHEKKGKNIKPAKR